MPLLLCISPQVQPCQSPKADGRTQQEQQVLHKKIIYQDNTDNFNWGANGGDDLEDSLQQQERKVQD
jgi:hypothetical protein